MDHCGSLSSFLAFSAEHLPTQYFYSNQYAICPSINDNRVYQGKLWGVNERGDGMPPRSDRRGEDK
jgi:hypothetical protein